MLRRRELRAALTLLAGLVSADQFGGHVAALQTDRERLRHARELGSGLAAAQLRVLGITADTEAAIIAGAVTWPGEPRLRRAADHVQLNGSPGRRGRRRSFWGGSGLHPMSGPNTGRRGASSFLRRQDEGRKAGAFVNPKLAATQPDLVEAFIDEVTRVLAVEDARRGLKMAAVSHALVTLAGPVLDGYARRKDESGLLDYDDLIGRTQRLLIDPGAAWVLYKLDGGLDHLLLDEVQDTAPAQWRIAHALTAEFFAGTGARDDKRTRVRGRRPQAVDLFLPGRRHRRIRPLAPAAGQRVQAAGASGSSARWKFRSVRQNPCWRWSIACSRRRLPPPACAIRARWQHVAERTGQAGAVELWPLTPPPPNDDPTPWTVPDANQGLKSAPHTWPRRWRAGSPSRPRLRDLPSRGRPLRPGDVMVLVRRRNDFARCLLRELKRCGVPVAGLDRLVLTEQPAVQDLMALADALLLPQDDLAFACFLTSPLGNLSDNSLGNWRSAARARCGRRCARGPPNARTGRPHGTCSRRCWHGWTTPRRTHC